MICFEVHSDDVLVCRAGSADASLLSVILSGYISGEIPASFHVSGLQELPDERRAHIYWVEEHPYPLALRSSISISVVDSDNPTPPIEIKATDSVEYLEEQREFEEFEKSYMGPEPQLEIHWPTLKLKFLLNGEEISDAQFLDGEGHIMCSINWHKWSPDHCKVYVRSFGSGLTANKRETDWFRGFLEVGDRLDVFVNA
jgi:hypothetical protein